VRIARGRRYGKIGGIWFDGWWDRPDADWGLTECYDRIHTAQPQALVGNNHHRKPFPGEDFQMFEQDLPGENKAGFNKAEVSAIPLETCLTLNRSGDTTRRITTGSRPSSASTIWSARAGAGPTCC